LALACSSFSFAQQQKKEDGNAVERTAKRAANATKRTAKNVDKALTHAGEKTENWVKEKTK
jgi:hypothetical protein